MKKKVLIFIDWFTPGFKAGGPIKSVTNIINSLNKFYDFHIVTSDRDINDQTAYNNIQINSWITKEKHKIIYLSPNKRDEWILNHLKEVSYDAYYFNSIFSKYFTLKPLLLLNKYCPNKKIIVAPRGMLGKGALAIKPLKKQVFLFLAKIIGYFKNVTWHATNKEEANDVLKHISKQSKIKIASNISLNSIYKKEILKTENELKLVFFSRISPKKNLLYALELLVNINNVSIDIYGSIEDQNYWKKCNQLIASKNINATYKDEILPVNVSQTLSDYHFLLLPTLHENFGHVIVEALTAGCGLIISNETPWRNLEEKNIGWDIELNNKNKFLEVIKSCVSLNSENYNAVRNSCYNFVEDELNSKKEIEDTKKLFI